MSVVAEWFAERAKSQVNLELANPTEATVQGFLLMYKYKESVQRSAEGQMFFALASSLITTNEYQTSMNSLLPRVDKLQVSPLATIPEHCTPAFAGSGMTPSEDSQGHESRKEKDPTVQEAGMRETTVQDVWGITYRQLEAMIGGDPFAGIGAADISGGTELYWKCWKT